LLGQSLGDAVRGKAVLITGASSGIGRAAAVKIGDAGGEVVLVARTRGKLDEVAADIRRAGGVAHVHPCDLSDLEDIDRMADEVLEQHGRVDILVNNAGRSIRRSIALSYDRFHDFERTMQLNYFGPVRLILRVLPGMRERRSGRVVNLSSVSVQTGPRRTSSRLGNYGELTRTLSPGSMDAIASTAYRLFPDSRAARGETGEGGPERPSRAGRLFANLFRGGEW